MPQTKAELKSLLDLSRSEGDALKEKLEETDTLNKELERRVDSLEAELATAQQDAASGLRRALLEANDLAGKYEWELQSLKDQQELELLRTKEQLREEINTAAQKELDARDELIALLKEKLEQVSQVHPEKGSTVGDLSGDVDKHPLNSTEGSDPFHRMRLPALSKFSGAGMDKDEDAYSRWIKKLEKHAELQKWSDREKLLQFELLLTDKAEQMYELLPEGSKTNFADATEALRSRLNPVRREALVSAQLMRRKQRSDETVDSFSQDFERLFDVSYGRRAGMDEESKELLKRDLFTQGLKLKWQEKVLPTAKTFAEALHLARAAEEQENQLAILHPPRPRPPGKTSESPTAVSSQPVTKPRCHRCGSTQHLLRDCPQRQPPGETPGRFGAPRKPGPTSSAVTTSAKPTESEGDKCDRLLKEWTEAEHQRLSRSFSVTRVTGPVGPLYHAEVKVAGQPAEALIDTGSPASIISFNLFKELGRKAGLTADVLHKPDVVLRDFNQFPIPVAAMADVELEFQGVTVTTTLYIHSDHAPGIAPFLLGTNAIVPLGLVQLASGIATENKREESSKTVAVRLVRTERIPGRHGVVVRARLDEPLPRATLFFQPSREASHVEMEESLLQGDGDTVLIPVHNVNEEVSKLNQHTKIGEVCLCTEEAGQLVVENTGMANDGTVFSVQQSSVPASEQERRDQLLMLLSRSSGPKAKKIVECVLEYPDAFALTEDDQGEVVGVEHHIETADHPPIRQPPYRVPFSLRDKISGLVQKMLDAKVIQESSSPWASPVVMVKKKDQSLRFCVDYRRLNAITRKDTFPLPRIDDLLDQLKGKAVFSTLDAKRGYWQIRVHPSSQDKTAFVTHDGLYEFRVMPFGLCNAPATFQRLMQRVLTGLNSFCSVYIDDILVFSRSVEEHVHHLSLVFDRLRQVGLKLHPDKCSLGCSAVAYLGHVISAEGITPNPDKLRAVEEFPVPTTVRSLREFLGLAGYYRKFVRDFSKIAAPLYSLLRSNAKFWWSDNCSKAFEKLKTLLTTSPVLVYPDFTKPFIVHTDASGEGLGVVLEQEQDDGSTHPVSYASRSLSKHEARYGITELEGLAVVWALKHYKAYLWGNRCVVYTDHAPVRSLLTGKHSTGKLARWADFISEFDVDIQYRPGRKNANADALSRSPVDPPASDSPFEIVQVGTVDTQPTADDHVNAIEDLKSAQREDPDLKIWIQYLESDQLPDEPSVAKKLIAEKDNYTFLEGVLYRVDEARCKLCICVPQSSRHTLLSEAHCGPFAGHFAPRSLYNTLRSLYWWKGMYRDIYKYCRSCLTCASYQGTTRRSKPPLIPIPVGGPFQRVGVDIMELPLTVNGNKYVIVFIDYLTKWVEAFAVADQTATTIAQLLVDNVICRHGVPEELLSDRGANLLSNVIQDVCDICGMKKINTTAYHPQGDGLVENFNRTLRSMIAKHCEAYGPNWDEYLQKLLFAYRTKVHDSTKESPFALLYGRDARVPTQSCLSYQRSPYTVDMEDYVIELKSSLANAWRVAQQEVSQAQERQKSQYNKRSKERTWNVGDRVMVYMPYETTGKKRKLARPFYGPYRILEVHPNGVTVRPVDRPNQPPIRVNVDRVTPCPAELPNVSWLGPKRRKSVNK